MIFILDTDVISNLSKQHPNKALLRWIKETPAEEMRIPLAAVFEIFMGIEGLKKEKKADKAAQLEHWIEGLLENFRDQIDAPDTSVARLQAEMFSAPALRNLLQPNPNSSKLKFWVDLIVAATAIIRRATIVSFNVADYEVINKEFALPGLYHPGREEWMIEYSPSDSYYSR